MTTKELIEKMPKDEALCKKLEACKTPEEAYAAAREAGLSDELEAFTSAMTAVNKQIKGELSDAELDSIAGGASAEEIIGYSAAGLFPVAAAAAAA